MPTHLSRNERQISSISLLHGQQQNVQRSSRTWPIFKEGSTRKHLEINSSVDLFVDQRMDDQCKIERAEIYDEKGVFGVGECGWIAKGIGLHTIYE